MVANPEKIPPADIISDPFWLGARLVALGKITPEQFASAKAAFQKNNDPQFTYTLERLAFVSQKTVATLTAEQARLPFEPLPPGSCSPDLAKKISYARARKFLTCPVREEGQTIVIGVVDPHLYTKYEAQRDFLSRKIRFVVAPRNDIISAIEAAHSPVAPASNPRETLNELINNAIRAGATDIHFDPKPSDMHVRHRLNGYMKHVCSLGRAAKTSIIQAIKTLSNCDVSQKNLPQGGQAQFLYGANPYNLRISIMPTIRGEDAVIRIQDENRDFGSLVELGLDTAHTETTLRQANVPNGLFLVTGPTGSGKTTLLHSILNSLDLSEDCVFTIEDPVEYQNYQFKQVKVDDKVGRTFEVVLNETLRQDPDVILMGEIRNMETAMICMRLSLTGHRIFATLHTNDAVGAINRLIELGVPPYLVSSAVKTISAVRLVRTLCPHCARPVSDAKRTAMTTEFGEGNYLEPGKCEKCHSSGYGGQTAIFELFPTDTDEVEKTILAKLPSSHLATLYKNMGCKTMFDHGLAKVRAGVTTIQEIYAQIPPSTK
jgi:type II secretory ATPase GspE/PulE/Tfp pilus assembly ATPase PilB-like protein